MSGDFHDSSPYRNSGDHPGYPLTSLKDAEAAEASIKAENPKRGKRAWATRGRNLQRIDSRIAKAVTGDDR